MKTSAPSDASITPSAALSDHERNTIGTSQSGRLPLPDRNIKIREAAAKRAARNALLKQVIADHGPDALRKVAPLTFHFSMVDGVDPDDRSSFQRKCVLVTPMVNPLFDAVLTKVGASLRGRRTYSISVGDKASTKNLQAALSALPDNVLYSGEDVGKVIKRGEHNTNSNTHGVVSTAIRSTPCGSKLQWTVNQLTGCYYDHRPPHLENCAVKITSNQKELFIQVVTVPNKDGVFDLFPGAPNLHLMRPEVMLDPILVTPDMAVALYGTMRAQGYELPDLPFMDTFQEQLASAVVAQAVPGAPGMARLLVGKHLKQPKDIDLQPLYPGCTDVVVSTMTASQAAAAVADSAQDAALVNIHPEVADMIAMVQAPIEELDGMLPYQNIAVAWHRATQYGYLNACAIGLGKTAQALRGCREKAAEHSSVTGAEPTRPEAMPDNYRVLVSMQKTLIDQWQDECAKFFPEAAVHKMNGSVERERKKTRLAMEQAAENGQPIIVLASYETCKLAADFLMEYRWDDLVLDESIVVVSGSNRSAALWELRNAALVGVALTGTPVEKSLDDVGRMVAWARNQPEMFYGRRLEKNFDVTIPEERDRLWATLGNSVFRRDQSEIADQLPQILTQVVKINLHPSEIKLGNGARTELKRIYLELVEKIEKAAQLDPDDPNLQYAKEELQSARGAVLGGITLARLAATDPEAIADSESLAAAVLEDAGLIAPAVKHGLVKRRYVCNNVQDRIANGEACLVFTEFSTVARHLTEDMEALGLRVGAYLGGMKQDDRAQMVRSFQGTPCETHAERPMSDPECDHCLQPTLDVLVMTQSATHGLNLQRATTIVHQELPYLPSRLVQRNGRSSRIAKGVENRGPITSLIPLATYGDDSTPSSEEIIAAAVFARAATSMVALDSSRGIDARKTEFGQSIKGLGDVISKEQQGDKVGIFDLAKSLLAEDGTGLPDIDEVKANQLAKQETAA